MQTYFGRCSKQFCSCPLHRCMSSLWHRPRRIQGFCLRSACFSIPVNILRLIHAAGHLFYFSYAIFPLKESIESIPFFQTTDELSLRAFGDKTSNAEPIRRLIVFWPATSSDNIFDDLVARGSCCQLWSISQASDDGHLCERGGNGRGAEGAAGERGKCGTTKGKHDCCCLGYLEMIGVVVVLLLIEAQS